MFSKQVSRDLGDLTLGQRKMRLKMVRPGGSLESLSSRDLAKGTVTDYVWANPDVFVKLDAKDDIGNTVHWMIEGQNPVSMAQLGWSKNTFKHGVNSKLMPCRPRRAIRSGSLGLLAQPHAKA